MTIATGADAELPPIPVAAAPHAKVDVRSVLGRFVVTVVLLMVALAAVAAVFHEPIVRGARAFVSAFGGWGVFAGFFIADAFPVPLPHDVVSSAGLLGGLGCPDTGHCGARGFWTVVAWASAGSLVGSSLGFAIGRYASRTATFARVMARRGNAARALVERYGVHALVIGALTPVNYCITVWATGAWNLSWGRFLAVTWLRIPRVIFYLWLFKLGLLDSIA